MIAAAMEAAFALQRLNLRAVGLHRREVTTSFGPMRIYEKPRKPGRQRPTWVFAHGFAGQAAMWARCLRILAPECDRIICLELPGHGGTPPPPDEMPAIAVSEAMCREALDSLLAEDGQPAVLVGVSMGGLAMTVYATERPQQTAAVALISPAGAPMSEQAIDGLLRGFSPKTYADACRTVEQFLPDASLKPLLALSMRSAFSNPYYTRLLQEFRGYEFFTAERLQRLPNITLLLWGTEDSVMPPECREFFWRHLPSAAEKRHVEGWNHFAVYWPGPLARALKAWGIAQKFI